MLIENNFNDDNGPDEKQFNYNLLNEFAVSAGLTDALLLLAVYKRFAADRATCTECKDTNRPLDRTSRKRKLMMQNHSELHEVHQKNAKLFSCMKDQKRICQCAVDCVLAEKRYKTHTMTRNELFKERLCELMQRLKDLLQREEWETDNLVAAMLLLNMLLPEHHNKPGHMLLVEIIETMILNPPKSRYYIFRGPMNTGKTTIAAALLDMLQGTTLNVNGNPERLNFELGCAIDNFVVLFEDVKGTPLKDDSKLPPGLGIANLDNLRDYLDGHVPVNLERKHQNKVSQIFPPGLITMNEYKIPPTLRVRMKGVIDFKYNADFYYASRSNKEVFDTRMLTKGETLLALLLVNEDSEKRIAEDVLRDHADTVCNLKTEFDKRVFRYQQNMYAGRPYWQDSEPEENSFHEEQVERLFQSMQREREECPTTSQQVPDSTPDSGFDSLGSQELV